MRQNIALCLFFTAGLCAECIPVMLVLVGLGLALQIKKCPARAEQKKITYIYSNPKMRKSQGGGV